VVIWPAGIGEPRRLSLNLFYAEISCGSALNTGTIQPAKGGEMVQMFFSDQGCEIDALDQGGVMN
jgi:hypothetical protein